MLPALILGHLGKMNSARCFLTVWTTGTYLWSLQTGIIAFHTPQLSRAEKPLGFNSLLLAKSALKKKVWCGYESGKSDQCHEDSSSGEHDCLYKRQGQFVRYFRTDQPTSTQLKMTHYCLWRAFVSLEKFTKLIWILHTNIITYYIILLCIYCMYYVLIHNNIYTTEYFSIWLFVKCLRQKQDVQNDLSRKINTKIVLIYWKLRHVLMQLSVFPMRKSH